MVEVILIAAPFLVIPLGLWHLDREGVAGTGSEDDHPALGFDGRRAARHDHLVAAHHRADPNAPVQARLAQRDADAGRRPRRPRPVDPNWVHARRGTEVGHVGRRHLEKKKR